MHNIPLTHYVLTRQNIEVKGKHNLRRTVYSDILIRVKRFCLEQETNINIYSKFDTNTISLLTQWYFMFKYDTPFFRVRNTEWTFDKTSIPVERCTEEGLRNPPKSTEPKTLLHLKLPFLIFGSEKETKTTKAKTIRVTVQGIFTLKRVKFSALYQTFIERQFRLRTMSHQSYPLGPYYQCGHQG